MEIPEQLRRLTESDIFNYEQFAYFIDRLSQVEDEHGKLIDSTQCLYGSGMAYGHSHGNAASRLFWQEELRWVTGMASTLISIRAILMDMTFLIHRHTTASVPALSMRKPD